MNFVVISSEYQPAIEGLWSCGISTVFTQKCENLAPPVCRHADMLLHHLGGDRLLLAPGADGLRECLANRGFDITVISRKLSSDYPEDCLLNCARFGHRIFCGKQAAQEIEQYCHNTNVKIITVGQGYTRCSVCAVTENALITADEGLAKVAAAQNMDVLKIRAGWIELDGYDYGFIGGACGKLSRNTIAFVGEIEQHPDYENIRTFLKNYGIYAESLCGGPLRDIGGLIPLLEKR